MRPKFAQNNVYAEWGIMKTYKFSFSVATLGNLLKEKISGYLFIKQEIFQKTPGLTP